MIQLIIILENWFIVDLKRKWGGDMEEQKEYYESNINKINKNLKADINI